MTAKQHDFVWWAQAVGITCGATIALATILHFLGITSVGFAMIPVRDELRVMSDSLRASDLKEARERIEVVDSLKHTMDGNHRAVMSELHDIHNLLVHGRGR